ncbi:MAG: polyphosphate kinase 2 family protein [Candidatus Promineifilaceae bacterium]|jgi:PPK2 family polyphosphate:nucleotide phosphotransferase
MISVHQLHPNQTINLSEFPTSGHVYHQDRDSAEDEFRALRKELIEYQRCFYADGSSKLLLVLQAMDAGGKDGTIRRVFKGVNPQGVRVTSFKVPTKPELDRDFLWRVHMAVPPKGMIGVFNRSHYEDVLVVRVDNIVPESVWRPRYAHINAFEKLLVESGTTIVKVYLHISKEEQRDRFQARLDEPDKNWKFSLEDLEKRKLWGDYQAAYEEMLENTTTSWAPWYVVPADQKWYRNLAIMRLLIDAMKEINPQYPTPEGDLSGIVIK